MVDNMDFVDNIEEMITLQARVEQSKPLIHCITNPISIHDCANVVLATGARPIMAEHPLEVADITKTAQALALNLGNITDARIQSIQISAKTALEYDIPVVLDLVGVGCSSLRKKLAGELIHFPFSRQIIKGNMSEIRAMCSDHQVSGIDVSPQDALSEQNASETIQLVQDFAKQCQSVIFVSGATDVISDGETTYLIKNGCDMLARITGTGCMSTVLSASYLSEGDALTAACAAAATFGISGELAVAYSKGTGSFQINLMDELSEFNADTLRTKAKIEKWRTDHE